MKIPILPYLSRSGFRIAWGRYQFFVASLIVGLWCFSPAAQAETERQSGKTKPNKKLAVKKTKPVAVAKEKNRQDREQKIEITGSRLPQRVSRYGLITDTAVPVIVIGRRYIERTGAGTTTELLRTLSSFR